MIYRGLISESAVPLGILGGIFGIGADLAKVLGGMLIDAIFGVFGLFTSMISQTVGGLIANAYVSTILYTPAPTRNGNIELVQQPTNGSWGYVYTNYYEFFVAGIFILLIFYVLANFVSAAPYVNVRKSEEIRGGIIKYFIFGVFGWPIIAFALHFTRSLIVAVKPDTQAINFLISELIGVMAAATASPFAILTSILATTDILVFVIAISLYAARLLIIYAVPIFAPLFMAGYFMRVPIVQSICETVFRTWVKMLIAPLIAAFALKAGTVLLLNNPSPNTWTLNGNSQIVTNKIAYFSLSLLIPLVAIGSMGFVLLASTPSSITTPLSVASMKTKGTSTLDAVGEERWDTVSTKENWGKAAKTGLNAAVNPVGTTKKGASKTRSRISNRLSDGTDWMSRQLSDGTQALADSEVAMASHRAAVAGAGVAASPRQAAADLKRGSLPRDPTTSAHSVPLEYRGYSPDDYSKQDLEELSAGDQLQATNIITERLEHKDLDEADGDFRMLGTLLSSGPQSPARGLAAVHDQFDEDEAEVNAAFVEAQDELTETDVAALDTSHVDLDFSNASQDHSKPDIDLSGMGGPWDEATAPTLSADETASTESLPSNQLIQPTEVSVKDDTLSIRLDEESLTRSVDDEALATTLGQVSATASDSGFDVSRGQLGSDLAHALRYALPEHAVATDEQLLARTDPDSIEVDTNTLEISVNDSESGPLTAIGGNTGDEAGLRGHHQQSGAGTGFRTASSSGSPSDGSSGRRLKTPTPLIPADTPPRALSSPEEFSGTDARRAFTYHDSGEQTRPSSTCRPLDHPRQDSAPGEESRPDTETESNR